MLNESVINVLKNGMWDLATCANGEPNVVPVAFKDVTEDIFITKNGKIVAKLTNPHQDRVEVAKSLFGIILKISIISSPSIILSKLAITMTVIETRLPILHI